MPFKLLYRVGGSQAKTTLNVLYRLTTEMGECQGWENSTGMTTPAKTTLNVLYRLTTEMGECGGCIKNFQLTLMMR